MKSAVVVAALLGVLVPLPSVAHITLVYPPPRPGMVSPIGSPCGYSPDPGRTTAQPLLPGATIEVRWNEWINHPSHFRISFDSDGQDDFVDPASPDDFYTVPSVLLDAIADNGTGDHAATITLPMIECDNCTLQVIQVMTVPVDQIKPPPDLDGFAYESVLGVCLSGESVVMILDIDALPDPDQHRAMSRDEEAV